MGKYKYVCFENKTLASLKVASLKMGWNCEKRGLCQLNPATKIMALLSSITDLFCHEIIYYFLKLFSCIL